MNPAEQILLIQKQFNNFGCNPPDQDQIEYWLNNYIDIERLINYGPTTCNTKDKDLGWILESYFDYQKPIDSVLNIAAPSAVSYYYYTFVTPGNNYKFVGEFPNENLSFQSSLTLYTLLGAPVLNFEIPYTINNRTNPDSVNWEVPAELIPETRLVLLRIYLNKQELNSVPNSWLFKIYKNNILLSNATNDEREKYSNALDPLLEKLLQALAPTNYQDEPNSFYLPETINGLFPQPSHYYLSCLMGNSDAVQISGVLPESSDIPYLDFIGVNQTTTRTKIGIPFYELPKEYKFIIANYDYPYTGNLPIFRFPQDTTGNHRIIVFRVIDYKEPPPLLKKPNSPEFLSLPLTSLQTKEYFKNIYPNTEFLYK